MNTRPQTARLAGILYVLVIIGGIFAEFAVRSNLIVSGDTAATLDNIRSNESLFRFGFMSDLIAHTCYFLLALVLYSLLKPVNHDVALLFMLIVAIGVAIMCLNMLNQFAVLMLIGDADYLAGFTSEQLDGLILLFLDLHKYGYLIAQIFYGGWLLPLGYVVYKSGFFPKILGVLLMVASVGYVLDFFTVFMFPDFQADATGIMLAPAVIAEFAFCGWLLIRGVKPSNSPALYRPETALAH